MRQVKMVSNIYLNDAIKTGKFLMRRAEFEVKRKSPNAKGVSPKCIFYALILAAIGAAVFSVYFITSLVSEAQEGSLYAKSASKLRSKVRGENRHEAAAAVEEAPQVDVAPAQPPASQEQAAGAADTARSGEDGHAAGGVEVTVDDGSHPALARSRTVVLYTENGRINTGVWPSWGTEGGHTATLNWAAAGVQVHKSCPKPCTITHDQGALSRADAVIVETVNHPKFGLGGSPLDWPSKADNRPNPRAALVQAGALPRPRDDAGRELSLPSLLPAVGVFYYEPESNYPAHSAGSEEVQAHTEFSVVASMQATLPITLVCPWGKAIAQYLSPPPTKHSDHLLAYFSEHGYAERHSKKIEELFTAAGGELHAYNTRKNRETPPEAGGDPYQLSRRLDFVGTYKFVLVTDGASQEDFINPEWSQAFLAGTVPIYAGAPNAHMYAPGPRSYLLLHEFESGEQLWSYIRSFAGVGDSAVERAYARFFDWKGGAGKAAREDEPEEGKGSAVDGRAQLGTGEGTRPAQEEQVIDRAVQRWERPPVPSDGEAVARAEGEGASEGFAMDSEVAWRAFRRHMDHCVHYAECRVCSLVHELT